MIISELIDELLVFEMTDKVKYLNLQIGTGPTDFDLTKSTDGPFRKWSEASGDVPGVQIGPEAPETPPGGDSDEKRLA